MLAPVLATKLYIPPPRPRAVFRAKLLERLNEGLLAGSKLTLISASAGFGKTTLVSEWVSALTSSQFPVKEDKKVKVAWFSLDEGDSESTRFLTHLVAALQTVTPNLGKGLLAVLQAPQPPPTDALLSSLLNGITAIPDRIILVLDDYHTIDSQPVDEALLFFLEHLPPQMHLVIATREDPPLPLARLRARGQLTELRAADLRFTPAEATEFLNQTMGLNLSIDVIATLETRTEGWIAGLQLASLAMQGLDSMHGEADTAHFIQSFTGSHRFVLDYLLEEVLHKQSEAIQTFLLRTSMLERLCGPLCDAILNTSPVRGQETLESLEHANLFLIPLDSERRWYRYHHLFGDLLRQRLQQSLSEEEIIEVHIRASDWYKENDLLFEAFHHATAANDVARAEGLIENQAIGLHFRSVAMPVIDWLISLPDAVKDAQPKLWVKSATIALVAGQTTGVEERLQSAETALAAQTDRQNGVLNEETRDLIGQIACARATLALTHYDPDNMIIQAHRAIEYLPSNDLTFRFIASWALASAYMFQGKRTAAIQACMEGIAICQQSGDVFSTILALANLGTAQEMENQLHKAVKTYQRVLELSGEYPQPNAAEVCLGLARIYYEWNDLELAEQYGRQSLELSHMFDQVIDRFIISEIFLARLKLTQGDVDGAAKLLDQADESARQKNFILRLPEIAAARVPVMLLQGQVAAAAQLAEQYELPICQARVYLAQGTLPAALAILETLHDQMESKGWKDEMLKVMVLSAVAHQANGEPDKALRWLGEALKLAEPGGFIRLFVDEGEAMRLLIAEYLLPTDKPQHQDKLSEYADKILAAFPQPSIDNPPTEVLSPRELEVLVHIAAGRTNQEIAAHLFLSLYTVKAHVRNIFGKLNVRNRTQAVAKARQMGLLHQS